MYVFFSLCLVCTTAIRTGQELGMTVQVSAQGVQMANHTWEKVNRSTLLFPVMPYGVCPSDLYTTDFYTYSKYTDKLGQGAFGAVYKAISDTGSQVAVKDILDTSKFNALEIEPSRYNLPFNSEIIEVFQPLKRKISLVYELYTGGELDDYLKKYGALNPEQVHSVASQLAVGLWRLHLLGYVHRDLKPQNIMIHKDSTSTKVVICDFGLAAEGCSRINPQCATGTSGTPLYLAPAQWTGGRYGPEVDWHAFGVILYQLFVGRDGHPFGKHYTIEALAASVLGRNPNLDLITDNELRDLLKTLLTRKVDQFARASWFAEVASEHPVLKHRYWLSKGSGAGIRDYNEFWSKRCLRHYPDQGGEAIHKCDVRSSLSKLPLCRHRLRVPEPASKLPDLAKLGKKPSAYSTSKVPRKKDPLRPTGAAELAGLPELPPLGGKARPQFDKAEPGLPRPVIGRDRLRPKPSDPEPMPIDLKGKGPRNVDLDPHPMAKPIVGRRPTKFGAPPELPPLPAKLPELPKVDGFPSPYEDQWLDKRGGRARTNSPYGRPKADRYGRPKADLAAADVARFGIDRLGKPETPSVGKFPERDKYGIPQRDKAMDNFDVNFPKRGAPPNRYPLLGDPPKLGGYPSPYDPKRGAPLNLEPLPGDLPKVGGYPSPYEDRWLDKPGGRARTNSPYGRPKADLYGRPKADLAAADLARFGIDRPGRPKNTAERDDEALAIAMGLPPRYGALLENSDNVEIVEQRPELTSSNMTDEMNMTGELFGQIADEFVEGVIEVTLEELEERREIQRQTSSHIEQVVEQHCNGIEKLLGFADKIGNWVFLGAWDVKESSAEALERSESRQIGFEKEEPSADGASVDEICSVVATMYEEQPLARGSLLEAKSDKFNMQCRTDGETLDCGRMMDGVVGPQPYVYKSAEGESMHRQILISLAQVETAPDKLSSMSHNVVDGSGKRGELVLHITDSPVGSDNGYGQWNAKFLLKSIPLNDESNHSGVVHFD